MYANEKYLIELLKEASLLDDTQIEDATHQKKSGQTLLEALVSQGKVSEENVAQTLAVNSGMEFVDLLKIPEIDPAAVRAITADAAARFKVIPIVNSGHELVVAVTDPLDFDALDSVRHVLPMEPQFVCGTKSAIETLIVEHFGAELDASQMKSLGEEAISMGGEAAEGDDAPVIRMVYQILQEAYQAKASDIHIEPMENEMRVRYRIDGALHKVQEHPKELLGNIVSRVKIMSGSMSVAEKRLPQDGRIQATFGKGELDLRVSTVPTTTGESIVMRILDKSSLSLGLDKIGFFTDDQAVLEELIRLPDGILLVTGPTGSGKTTTLYSCIHAINTSDRKIITVEDPVEYLLSGINQVQVKESIGMTFAAALRAILRQAPNIIMIGEIRDLETASIAINASLTGHLVFSTLHTNDAPSAVARLADIGVKKFLIASAVRSIMAQRLVRHVCKDCGAPAELTGKELRALNLTSDQLTGANLIKGEGCRNCRMTGYRGRIGLFEIFNINEEVRLLINGDQSTPELRKRARQLGMRTLREDGIRKVLSGLTTASEVMRVTMADSD
ncbi:MAG: ATPase, T2SS/T4P/T4SS family [Verrucomicrobiales bacterium]|nr:ATPase, T2SS/T4P/T4SS family [Verrucomicrobiales bacterium]